MKNFFLLTHKMNELCSLVITSDVRYAKPLSNILTTIRNANITQSILITSNPIHKGIDTLCRHHSQGVDLIEINTNEQNFEYIGFEKLKKHCCRTIPVF